MLGHWPEDNSDELIYSICARYKMRFNLSDFATRRILFGTRSTNDPAGLPTRLSYLASCIPSGFGISLADLVDKHTTVPLHRAFWDAEEQSQFTRALEDINSRFVGLQIKSLSDRPTYLRFCPECVREEREQLLDGAYWHTLHQVEWVLVCPKHRVYLNDSTVRRGADTTTAFVCADQVIEMQPRVKPLKEGSKCDMHLLWFAEQSAWLLSRPSIRFDPQALVRLYKAKLAVAGLARFGGNLRAQELSKRFRRTFPNAFLERLGRTSEGRCFQKRRISHLLKPKTMSAINHLMMMRLCGLSADMLQIDLQQPQEIEPGPWPCLNPACGLFGTTTIETYDRHKIRRDGRIVGRFTCACGFSYLRCIPDISGAYRTKPWRIENYGREWDQWLSALWMEDVPIEQIEQKLAVSESVVKHAVVRLNLPISCRKRIRTKWLEEHSPEICSQLLPPKITGKQGNTNAGTVDWGTRDSRLSALVPAVRESLLKRSGPPSRVSKQRLMEEIGFEHAVAPSSRLPKTMKSLEDATESLTKFYLRKLRWTTETLGKRDQRWTPTKLFKVSRIPHELRKTPMFAGPIADALIQLNAQGRSVGDYLRLSQTTADLAPRVN